MSEGATISTPASRLSKRLLLQNRNGVVVQNVAGVIDNAVLTVAGVGIQRNIGHHTELGKMLFEARHDARNQALGIGGLAAVRRLE